MTHKLLGTQVDDFTMAYIEAMLWSSCDWDDMKNGNPTPLDENYSATDLAPETLHKIIEECSDFQEQNEAYLNFAGSDEQNGHDFWLTRNHHGAGYWNRGYSEAVSKALTEAAHSAGEQSPYVSNEGTIWID